MFYDNSDPDFPNWWDFIDGEGDDSLEHPVEKAAAGDSDDSGEESPAIRYIVDPENGEVPEEEQFAPRFSENEEERVSEEEVVEYLTGGEYEKEIVERIWEFAEPVPGNDSSLWRKDEYGNWIYRLDYGRRESEFGWEIFDPAPGRKGKGVYAMRPLHWESYVRQFEARG